MNLSLVTYQNDTYTNSKRLFTKENALNTHSYFSINEIEQYKKTRKFIPSF